MQNFTPVQAATALIVHRKAHTTQDASGVLDIPCTGPLSSIMYVECLATCLYMIVELSSSK